LRSTTRSIADRLLAGNAVYEVGWAAEFRG
jgi:hypothetical protein